jgi:hypothetical protein
VLYYFCTFPFLVGTALYYSLCQMLLFLVLHMFTVSHIATFPSRVATALMQQLTDDYLLFQLGRISRLVHCTLPFCGCCCF